MQLRSVVGHSLAISPAVGEHAGGWDRLRGRDRAGGVRKVVHVCGTAAASSDSRWARARARRLAGSTGRQGALPGGWHTALCSEGRGVWWPGVWEEETTPLPGWWWVLPEMDSRHVQRIRRHICTQPHTTVTQNHMQMES